MKALEDCVKLVKNIYITALPGLKKSALCYITQKSCKIYTLCKDNTEDEQKSSTAILFNLKKANFFAVR